MADVLLAAMAAASASPIVAVLGAAVLSCSQLACAIQFVWSCATLLHSPVTPTTVRRMSAYVVTSATFMGVGLLATAAFGTGLPGTPTGYLVLVIAFTYGRIGTAFFQVAVFAPRLLQCRCEKGEQRVAPYREAAADEPVSALVLAQPALLAAEALAELQQRLDTVQLLAQNTQLQLENAQLRAQEIEQRAQEAELALQNVQLLARLQNAQLQAQEKETAIKAAEVQHYKKACAYLSHEIRNQLFPQSMIIKAMKADMPERAEDLSMILSALSAVSAILSSFLHMSKWEAGEYPVAKQLFPLVPLLQQVAARGSGGPTIANALPHARPNRNAVPVPVSSETFLFGLCAGPLHCARPSSALS